MIAPLLIVLIILYIVIALFIWSTANVAFGLWAIALAVLWPLWVAAAMTVALLSVPWQLKSAGLSAWVAAVGGLSTIALACWADATGPPGIGGVVAILGLIATFAGIIIVGRTSSIRGK